MKIDSPIGQFISVLEKNKEAAKTYQAKLDKNEAATRAVLIDPVIQALGWDITNLDMVEFERTYQDTRIDYALYGIDRKIKIIVEAKALGVNLNDVRNVYKLFSYAFKFGIDRVVLTNGITWQLFSSLQPNNQEPLNLDLNNSPLADVSSNLILTLDAAKFWGADPIPVPTPLIPPGGETVNEFVKLANLNFPIRGKSAPKQLRLPDGTVKPIRYWRDILSECCKFVLRNNPNLTIPFADLAGKKLKLFDWVEPQGSVTYEKFPYNGKTVYIYENFSSDGCVKNAQHVLKFLHQERDFYDVAVSF